MPRIHLTTFIAAPAPLVFDLSRSVDLHKVSMEPFREEAVAGTRFGLMQAQDTITYKARHLLRNRVWRMKITEMSRPGHFTGEQVQGALRELRHAHYFKPCDNGTIMIDLVDYRLPYGWLGRLLDTLFLRRYLARILELRIRTIKEFAESGRWRSLLQQ
ncbi:MAG TPA: SRPBCC family protein [Chitinophagaceae bacterium]|nr:SRPBCC family protein [Chitinophagaceae bacterium]